MSAYDDWPLPDGPVARSQQRREMLAEIDYLRAELARIRTDYEAQLEAVHDLTETLAEERVQHAAQVERIRTELAGTMAGLAAWDDALGAVLPELEREMAPGRPRADRPVAWWLEGFG